MCSAQLNCSNIAWRTEPLTSILPLRDGKTVLLFGVLHAGNLAIFTANQRLWAYSYTKTTAGAETPYPNMGFAFAIRSTDGGKTWDPNVINLDGSWNNQSSMSPKGSPVQALELSPFETVAGDILVLCVIRFAFVKASLFPPEFLTAFAIGFCSDRPDSSPWMWESWALRGSKGAAFGPATRGPFPLYACFDASITTTSGALLICGRFPAISCQLSLDSGMTWKMWTIDVSGMWAQGTMIELEPDLVMFTYGARGQGGGKPPWTLRHTKLRVDPVAQSLTREF